MSKDKLDLELQRTDFSKWTHLSKRDKQKLKDSKEHLEKLSNMIPMLSILLLFTNLLYIFKYSEYVFLVISILVIIISIYIINSTIKTKKKIKAIIFPIPKKEESLQGIKIRIYRYKMFDVMDNVVKYLVCFWGFLNLIGSVLRLF